MATLILMSRSKRQKKKRKYGGKVVYGNTKNVKKYVPPPSSKWEKDSGIVADINITREVLTNLVLWQTANAGKEISVFGSRVGDEIGTVVFVHADQSAHIAISAEQATKAEMEVVDAGGEPNVHIHSHPNFGTFWSGVDIAQQEERIEPMKKLGFNRTQTTFIVISLSGGFKSLVKVVEIRDGVIYENDGHLICDGVSLAGEVVRTAHTYTSVYSTGYVKVDVPSHVGVNSHHVYESAHTPWWDQYVD